MWLDTGCKAVPCRQAIGWCLEVPLSQLNESEAVPQKTADWVEPWAPLSLAVISCEAEWWFLGGPLVEKLGTNHNLCGCPRGHIWIVLTMPYLTRPCLTRPCLDSMYTSIVGCCHRRLVNYVDLSRPLVFPDLCWWLPWVTHQLSLKLRYH